MEFRKTLSTVTALVKRCRRLGLTIFLVSCSHDERSNPITDSTGYAGTGRREAKPAVWKANGRYRPANPDEVARSSTRNQGHAGRRQSRPRQRNRSNMSASVFLPQTEYHQVWDHFLLKQPFACNRCLLTVRVLDFLMAIRLPTGRIGKDPGGAGAGPAPACRLR